MGKINKNSDLPDQNDKDRRTKKTGLFGDVFGVRIFGAKSLMIFVLVVFGLGCGGIFFSSSLSAEIRGPAQVIDADTLVINGQNIRLHGIDAPEPHQECHKENDIWMAGKAAAEALRRVLKGQTILCLESTQRSYNRLVTHCQIDGAGQAVSQIDKADQINAGNDLGTILVRNGWAFDSPRYSKGRYADEEASVREKHLGIWAGSCDLPWVWRQSKQKGKWKDKQKISENQSVQQHCCKMCRQGRACGNSCIGPSRVCTRPPGCACQSN